MSFLGGKNSFSHLSIKGKSCLFSWKYFEISPQNFTGSILYLYNTIMIVIKTINSVAKHTKSVIFRGEKSHFLG